MRFISRKIIELTSALLRVTDRFPQEASREKLALNNRAYLIFKKVMGSNAAMVNAGDLEIKDIEIHLSVMIVELRRLQTWLDINPINLKVLEREYLEFMDSIRGKFEEVRPEFDKRPQALSLLVEEGGPPVVSQDLDAVRTSNGNNAADVVALTFRRNRILLHLRDVGPATVHELRKFFPEAPSLKTIQRDLNSIVESGAARRLSARRWSKYSLVLPMIQPKNISTFIPSLDLNA